MEAEESEPGKGLKPAQKKKKKKKKEKQKCTPIGPSEGN